MGTFFRCSIHWRHLEHPNDKLVIVFLRLVFQLSIQLVLMIYLRCCHLDHRLFYVLLSVHVLLEAKKNVDSRISAFELRFVKPRLLRPGFPPVVPSRSSPIVGGSGVFPSLTLESSVKMFLQKENGISFNRSAPLKLCLRIVFVGSNEKVLIVLGTWWINSRFRKRNN